MTPLLAAWRSSIVTKMVMAVTGLGLLAFVLGHLLGNLQVFLGPDALNHYSQKLQSMPALLWTARIGLLVFVVLHVDAAFRVVLQGRAARPQRYARFTRQESSYAARSLIVSGLAIVAYVTWHLMHFTFRSVHTQYVREVDGHVDVYAMVVGSFQNPLIAIPYVLAMVLIGMHLSHGIGASLQSLGLRHPRYGSIQRFLGPVTATVIAAGYIAIPLAVLLGLVELPAGGR